jgi:hypothetical protein
MLFKLFPNGLPSESLREDLSLLLNVPSADQEIIERWFREEGTSLDFDEERFRSLVAESSLLPDQFNRIGSALRFLLEAWYRQGVPFDDILADLVLLGFSDNEAETLGAVLGRLKPYGQPVFQRRMFQFTKGVGLPSVEDFNLICELRPVFEDYTYPPNVGSKMVHYSKMIGVFPIVVVEILMSDSKRVAVQLSEQEFMDWREAMNRVSIQMAVMKERLKFAPTDTKGVLDQ